MSIIVKRSKEDSQRYTSKLTFVTAFHIGTSMKLFIMAEKEALKYFKITRNTKKPRVDIIMIIF